MTILAGIRQKLGSQTEIVFEKGVDVVDEDFPGSDVLKAPPSDKVLAGIEAAVKAARSAEVVILALGENDSICRESASRISLNLPGYQEELLEAVHATGKPVVLVLSSGRPLSINWAVKNVPAILTMWFPGEPAGEAMADVLFGDYNPAGRLPVTMPRSVGQIQLNFPAKPGSQGRDPGQVTGPLFSFGHGLSYTKFAYTNLVITPAVQGPRGMIKITCDVKNTGGREGDEVVQLYLRDDYSSVITYEEVLRGFERVRVNPGETKTVCFAVTPEHLELYDRNGNWTVEAGTFTVYIGASSDDTRLEGSFTITDGSLGKEAAKPKVSRDDPL